MLASYFELMVVMKCSCNQTQDLKKPLCRFSFQHHPHKIEPYDVGELFQDHYLLAFRQDKKRMMVLWFHKKKSLRIRLPSFFQSHYLLPQLFVMKEASFSLSPVGCMLPVSLHRNSLPQ